MAASVLSVPRFVSTAFWALVLHGANGRAFSSAVAVSLSQWRRMAAVLVSTADFTWPLCSPAALARSAWRFSSVARIAASAVPPAVSALPRNSSRFFSIASVSGGPSTAACLLAISAVTAPAAPAIFLPCSVPSFSTLSWAVAADAAMPSWTAASSFLTAAFCSSILASRASLVTPAASAMPRSSVSTSAW